jgi:hypothetical protein
MAAAPPYNPLLSDEAGRHWIRLFCKKCSRCTTHDPLDLVDRFGDLHFADLRRRAMCSECGGRGATIQLATRWTERARGELRQRPVAGSPD